MIASTLMEKPNKTCLLTGATGLIGSHLLPELLKKFQKIYVITRTPISHPHLISIKADLCNHTLPSNLPKKIDYVIHLAQSEHFRDFPEKAENIFSVNTFSTLNLLNWAKSSLAKTFIYTSSGIVYGKGEMCKESDPLTIDANLGFYYVSKITSEILVKSYSNFFQTLIFRPFFVYGPGQKEQMLIPKLLNNVQQKNLIFLDGTEGMKINPIYVSDAVSIIISSLSLNESHTFNLAGPEVLSMRQIGDMIGDILGIKPCFEIKSDKPPSHLTGCITKLSKYLSTPSTTLKKGIETLQARSKTDPYKLPLLVDP